MPATPFARAALLLLIIASRAQGEPSLTGHSGIIAMPDGRTAPDGSLAFGVSRISPYTSGWAALSLTPWAEFTLRYSRVSDVPGLPGSPAFGDYKDKSVGVKLKLMQETDVLPDLAVGIDDFVTDTPKGLFESRYLALSKRFGDVDLTLGAGAGRIGGMYGGLRYAPSGLPNWSVVAEYDANDYRNDLFAAETGLNRRHKGANVGLEYRWGWLATQLSYQRDRAGVNLHARVPLGQREFIPKIDEPPPYTRITPRPGAAEWAQDPQHRRRLVAALHRQDFRNVRLRYAKQRLELMLGNSRMSSVPRAVGRAARTALLLAPAETRVIRITYTVRDLKLVSYEMFDLATLERYFSGEVGRKALAQTVAIGHPDPRDQDAEWELVDDAADDDQPGPAAIDRSAPEHASPDRTRARNDAEIALRLEPRLDTPPGGAPPLAPAARDPGPPSPGPPSPGPREHPAQAAPGADLHVEDSLIRRFHNKTELLDELEDSDASVRIAYAADGDLVSVGSEDRLQNRFSLKPALGFYLNDPSGAFHYELSAVASLDRRLGQGTYLAASAALTLAEDVSDVTQASNSVLPHVRSDIARYKNAASAKVNRVLVNRFFQPGSRVYGRVSGGLYEEMFAGAGGQLLYLPAGRRWGADIAVDWLRQRDYDGMGFLPYSTVTGILSLNYRLPYDMTATARAGRFLAKDNGVRFELKRRFDSGVEVGAWYSVTDARDTTSPGSEAAPYRDKGVFMSVPLAAMLTSDSQATAGLSLAPWTRDVAQLVASPGDLYRMVERALVFDVPRADGLRRFGDLDDDYDMGPTSATLLDRRLFAESLDDAGAMASTALSPGGLRALGVGLGAVLASSAVDRWVDRKLAAHHGNSLLRTLDRVGKAAPLVSLGVAGLASLSDDPRLSGTAVAAMKSGIAGLLVGRGAKYLAGRARPDQGLGSGDFDPFGPDAWNSSFPSDHVSATWGAIAPFATEYDMPWLYGLAVLSNAGRVAGRRHWLSDTVAGALLGYGLGITLWDTERRRWSARGTRIGIGPGGATLSTEF